MASPATFRAILALRYSESKLSHDDALELCCSVVRPDSQCLVCMATIPDTVQRATTDKTTRLDGLISAALDIASRDAVLRQQLKDAIRADRPSAALQAACDLIDLHPGASISALICDQK